jgi:hypothetical protein
MKPKRHNKILLDQDFIGLKNMVKLQEYMVDALAPEVDEGRG